MSDRDEDRPASIIYSKFVDDAAVRANLPEFLSLLKRRSSQLQEKVGEQNWSEVDKLTHTISGSALSYGFPLLAERSAALGKKSQTFISLPTAIRLLNDILALVEPIERGVKELTGKKS